MLTLAHCNALSNRGSMRMRPERSGRDGPGPSLRGGASSSRGRSSFSERDGRPMVMRIQVSCTRVSTRGAKIVFMASFFYCLESFKCQSAECIFFQAWLQNPCLCVCVRVCVQPFSSGRQVVVERSGREQGMRKEWHGGSGSQDRSFPDNRRMGDSRRGMLAHSRYIQFTNQFWVQTKALVCCQLRLGLLFSLCSHSSSGMSRIVQITSNSIPSGGSVGGFKPYKGTQRQF